MLEQIVTLGFGAKLVDPEEAAAAPTEDAAGEERSPLVAELLAQAKREDKPLVLEFSGKWCSACRELEETTLSDPRVREALVGVIFRRILVEDHRAAAARFGVRAIPQLRFLAADGSVQARDEGVVPVARMLGHLDAVKEKTTR